MLVVVMGFYAKVSIGANNNLENLNLLIFRKIVSY